MKKKFSNLNLSILIPSIIILVLLCLILLIFPVQSNNAIMYIRSTILNKFSIYYLSVGLIFVIALIVISFSSIGKIKLGDEKVEYSNFQWGAMIFTSTMAADIIFYSLHEWIYYYTSLPLDFKSMTLGEKQTWASSYPLFHWGAIPWSFYLILAVSYGYMFFVNKRTRQTMSEACRPLLKNKVDGITGKIIDIIAVVALLTGTATTFSITTPLLTMIICKLFNLKSSVLLTCMILIIIAIIYTLTVLSKFKGISKLSSICTISFALLICLIFFGDGISSAQYILESGFNGIGNMFNNFIRMSTWTDPARLSSGLGVNISNSVQGFPQMWTVFYWSYWIVWCVATPFFIAKISKGRTIKSVLLGGMTAGLSGTFTSFIVFGGYGMYNQVQGRINIADKLSNGSITPNNAIMTILNELPYTYLVLVILFITMIMLYASTFDALTYVMSSYSYKNIGLNEYPSKKIIVLWSFLLILLPIVLTIYDFGIFQIQSISIIAAVPLSIVLLIILGSFIRNIKSNK